LGPVDLAAHLGLDGVEILVLLGGDGDAGGVSAVSGLLPPSEEMESPFVLQRRASSLRDGLGLLGNVEELALGSLCGALDDGAAVGGDRGE
jgi:hypothetical protein